MSVIVRMSKNLGNQMFQYAAGLSLADHLGTDLALDLTVFPYDPRFKYELDRLFGIEAPAASEEARAPFDHTYDLRRAFNKTLYRRRRLPNVLPYEQPLLVRQSHRLVNRIHPNATQRTYWEPHYNYDRRFFDASDPVYLAGYWQSWRYSVDHLGELRRRFTVRPELTAPVEDLANKLRETNSVALHVRLGDRVSEKRFADLFTALTPTYYQRALDQVRRRHGDVDCYVFTDDPDHARRSLPADADATVVSGNFSTTPEQDLHLISQCRHAIIANSSFSWWAARLSDPERGGSIVAPKHWYAVRKYPTHDLYPTDWLTEET